jgi:hypothetical protein
MKFRTDFVTNSSSSSFVTFSVNSKTLKEILEKYSSEDGVRFFLDNDCVEVHADEYYVDIPNCKRDIVSSIHELFSYVNNDISEEILANKNNILNDITQFEMTVEETGWDGDSDERFYPEMYPKKKLKEYYEDIAKELECSVEDVTEEDFSEYVSDKISVHSNRVVYNHKTGKVKVTEDFYLEGF